MKNRGFFYIATPFTKFRGGPVAAASMAGRVSAQFIKAGIPVFCPISHSWAICQAAHMDYFDGATWLIMDEPLMHAAKALIIFKAEGWDESSGVHHERQIFRELGKPEYFLPAANLDPEFLRKTFGHL